MTNLGLFITLISFLPQSVISPLPFTVTPLVNTAGIYFHSVGTARISNDHFTLLSYLNISFFHHKLNIMKNYRDQVIIMCSKIMETQSCKSSLKLAQLHIPQLESKFDTIAHLVGHQSVLDNVNNFRKRRGLFNGVSKAFNWLFGVPDSDDASYYTQSINDLNTKNHDIQSLMKQQIHIISSALKNYNSSIELLKANEIKLNQNFVKFNHFSKLIDVDLRLQSQKQAILEYTSILFQIFNELNQEFDNIIAAILFAKQNTLHPIVITPNTLKNELSKITLNSDVQFPISIHDYTEIYKFFSLCEISAVYNNEILIFSIKIPLVREQLFNIYNLIPLPAAYPNSSIYSFIDSPFAYLLISTTKTHYSRLKDMSTCKRISSSEYICQDPIIHLTAERPVCETLLRNPLQKTIPTDCPTRTIKAKLEIWHRLSSNTWLFVISQKLIASISCDRSNSHINEVEFVGTGIFRMNTKCKCYTLSTILTSTSNQSTNYIGYSPITTVLDDDCCIKHHQFLQHDVQMEPIHLQNLNLDDLRHSQHKLQQFEEILDEKLRQSDSIYHTSWFATTIAVLVVFALAIFCCCCCNCHWLPYFGKLFPKRRTCCELPSICITNHNERFNVNEEQMVRFNEIRQRYDKSPDRQSVCSRSASVPPASVPVVSEMRSRHLAQT